MNNILKDQQKFTTATLKDDTLLNFAVNQEKHADKVLKKLAKSSSMTAKTRASLKPVASRPAAMYGSCKVHKESVEDCSPFRPILSALNTPTCELANFQF